MMNRYDMASRRTPKRYPGHVLVGLRAERGVGRPPQCTGTDFAGGPTTILYTPGRQAGKTLAQQQAQKEQPMIGPRMVQKIARRQGVRLTDIQAECLAHIERFGDARGYAPATVRSLEDRKLVSPKTGKLLQKGRAITDATKLALRD